MPEIEYKVDDTELQGMLKGILSRMGNLKPAMALIGETLHTSIMENFEEGGRPKKWKKLADRTMAERVRDGTSGRPTDRQQWPYPRRKLHHRESCQIVQHERA
ncbi:MAG: hypothetical protein B6240_14665 [Desulfobacteraceae bacterium 4572_87]|nr:MAG: hypothetical protein B6240_14665 [Desulfobacteraceae bacterium 4572_87]